MSDLLQQYDLDALHDVLRQMLRDVDDLCRRHGIRYTVHCGTLLGTVRHHGFIPWDDDIDLAMPYEDYRRFYKIAKQELNDRYEIQDIYDTKEHSWNWMRVYKRGTTYLKRELANVQVSHGIVMDIYPFFPAATGKKGKLQDQMLLLSHALRSVSVWKGKGFGALDPKQTRQAKLISHLPLIVRRPLSIVLVDVSRRLGRGSAYVCSVDAARFEPKFLAGEWEEMTEGDFDGIKVKMPVHYDVLLRRMYGNYMQLPPQEVRSGHFLMAGGVILDTKRNYTEYLEQLK